MLQFPTEQTNITLIIISYSKRLQNLSISFGVKKMHIFDEIKVCFWAKTYVSPFGKRSPRWITPTEIRDIEIS